jgi:protein subunit release factor B
MADPLPNALSERLRRLGVDPADVDESFVRGSGPGGQKINKTSSTVRLRHPPTGVEVRCQEERSQSQNRLLAWERLCRQLEDRQQAAADAAQAAREKERRRRRPKPPGVKRRMLADKRRRGETKASRKPPAAD